MDDFNRLFRRAAFGGFNRDDVIGYIEKMKNEFYEYKQQVEKTVQSLNEKISQLENGASAERSEDSFNFDAVFPEYENGDSAVSSTVGEINSATDHLKQTADRLCESLTQFMDQISQSCISVTVEAAEVPSGAEDEKISCQPPCETQADEISGEKSMGDIIESIFSVNKKENQPAKENCPQSADFLSSMDFIV